MKIQYISDLHLDKVDGSINNENYVKPVGDILVLDGDVCHTVNMYKFKNFFDYISKSFIYVLYVPGNHEYYNDLGKTIDEITSMMENFLIQYNNIILLNNKSIIINDVLFIGSCYWEQKEKIDFWIRINTTVQEINKINDDSKEFIINTLKSNNGKLKTVIITHYPPISYFEGKSWCNKRVPNDPREYSTLFNVWINGHTHRNHIHYENNVLYLANQKAGNGFNNSLCFKYN